MTLSDGISFIVSHILVENDDFLTLLVLNRSPKTGPLESRHDVCCEKIRGLS